MTTHDPYFSETTAELGLRDFIRTNAGHGYLVKGSNTPDRLTESRGVYESVGAASLAGQLEAAWLDGDDETASAILELIDANESLKNETGPSV